MLKDRRQLLGVWLLLSVVSGCGSEALGDTPSSTPKVWPAAIGMDYLEGNTTVNLLPPELKGVIQGVCNGGQVRMTTDPDSPGLAYGVELPGIVPSIECDLVVDGAKATVSLDWAGALPPLSDCVKLNSVRWKCPTAEIDDGLSKLNNIMLTDWVVVDELSYLDVQS